MVAKDNEHQWPTVVTEGHSPPLGLVSLQAEAGTLALQVVFNAKYQLGGLSSPHVLDVTLGPACALLLRNPDGRGKQFMAVMFSLPSSLLPLICGIVLLVNMAGVVRRHCGAKRAQKTGKVFC